MSKPSEHRLRYMVRDLSENISDEELNDFETKVPMDEYLDYEYSGSFLITRDLSERDEAVTRMCCGIITKDVELSNGEWLYLAFDYGH